MLYSTMKILVFFILAQVSLAKEHKRWKDSNKKAREEKVFSLFSIVQFPNDVCDTVSTSQTEGLCLASSECSAKSGTASGHCASGFGVCCLFSVSSCGSSVSNNVTYITNPAFPAAYSTTGNCIYTINKCSTGICQIRLDFSTLALNVATGPSIDMTCFGCCGAGCTVDCAAGSIATETDSLTVAGQTGSNPPVICGINSGYHMYVEAGGGATDVVTLDFYLGSTGNRMWNTKVTQIECNSEYRAPNGCVQYFTGATGSVASYGFQSGQLLAAQQYANCVRQEAGYCSITWRESSTTTPDPFVFPHGTAALQAESTVDICLNAYLHLQNGVFADTTMANQFCGGALGEDESFIPVPLTSSALPFQLGVLTITQTADGEQMEAFDGTLNTAATGFNLVYNQNPC